MFTKPVRKIGRTYRSVSGKKASSKTNGLQAFESTLERDLITLLDFDINVDRYQVQPVTIYYAVNDRSHYYTPDIAVYYKEELMRKPVLYEVKYSSELLAKQNEFEAKFAAAKDYAGLNGYEFQVIDETVIRTDKLYNAKFLAHYRHGKADEAIRRQIYAYLQIVKQSTVQHLLDELAHTDRANLLHQLWKMVAQRIITGDLSIKLNLHSTLWIACPSQNM